MLFKALAALHQACDPLRDEIFVVDNGSSDGSPEQVTAAYPQVHVIRNRCNNGFARANNQAIARASGEYVVLLNNDAFLEADTLTHFEKVFQTNPRCAVVAGQLVDAEGQRQRSSGRVPTALGELGLGFLQRSPRLPQPETLTEVESVVGACMAVRAAAIREAGALDNDFFFYFEETEWCHRLRAHGWQVLLEPAARITHLKGANTRGKRRGAQIEMLRSRLTFYRKTMNAPLALFVTFTRVLRLLINALVNLTVTALTLGMLSEQREKTVIYLLQLAWVVLGCPEGWGLQDKCPRGYTGTVS